MEKYFKPILLTVLLVLIAVVSATFVADYAMSTENHEATISSLDEKTDTIKVLTASSTLASVGVTALPGDVATPIAEKLADCSEYFLVVMCVLYAEKYLLTLIGAAVFRFLIPIACGLVIISLYKKNPSFRRVALKLAVFGLLLFLVIPLSVKTSNMIYETYQVSIDETIEKAQELTDETDAITDAQDNPNILESILSFFEETTTSITEKAGEVLNRFTEAIAVMLVTTCVIPILVLLFFLWLTKILWGVAIPVPAILGKQRDRLFQRKGHDQPISLPEETTKDE